MFPLLAKSLLSFGIGSDFRTTDFACYAARVDARRATTFIAVDLVINAFDLSW